jgi:hypothetical protein
MRWGMPPPPKSPWPPVTNIRTTTSPHWRVWLKPENRCLVPANSFAEYAPEPNPETKKKDVVWFALNEQRPLFAFAGIWTEFKGDRGTKSKPIPGPHLVYGFLTTAPNAIVEPMHPKAMPVILTTDEERDAYRIIRWTITCRAINLFAANFQFVIVARQFIFLVRFEAEEFHVDPRGNSKIHVEIRCSHSHCALDAFRCCCTCNERGHQHTVTRRFGRDGIHLRNVRVTVRLQSKPSLGRKAPSHFEYRDLIAHLFEDRQGIADLLSEAIEFGHHPAGRIGKVWQG